MRKLYLISIFWLLALHIQAQVPEQFIGVPGNRVVARGQLRPDSLLIASNRDSTNSARISGGILFNPVTGNLLYYNGSRFVVLPDQLSLDSAFKQNGNAFGDSARLGTNDNFPLNIKVNNARIFTFSGTPIPSQPSSLTGGGLWVPGGGLSLTGVAPAADNFRIGETLTFSYGGVTVGAAQNRIVTGGGTGVTYSSGEGSHILASQNFSPVSGNAVFNYLKLTGEVNQTGGANGIVRGLHINITPTATADYRAFQTDNGNNLLNTVGGSTAIGLSTNAPVAKLHVEGTGWFTDTLKVKKIARLGALGDNAQLDLMRSSDGATIGQVSVNGSEFVQNGVFGFMQLQAGSTAKAYITPTGIRLGSNATVPYDSQLESAYLVLLPGDSTTNRGAPIKFSLDNAKVLNVKQRGAMEAHSNYLMWTDSLLNRDTLATRRYIDSVATAGPAQVAYGNDSGHIISNINLTYIDSVFALKTKKSYPGNYVRAGDSVYRFSPYLLSYFFGNSLTAGSAITPQYYRWPARVANGLNHIELNYGIGQTRMVSLTPGDSAMTERTFLIPTYDSNRDGYLFFAYGTNDALTLSIDTATFRSSYYDVIDDATGKGWPASQIVLVSPGFFVHSISTLTNRGPVFIEMVRSIALSKGTRFVDARKAQTDVGEWQTLKLPDSTHLNDYGNQMWAGAVLDTLIGRKSADIRATGELAARAIHIRTWKNGGLGNAYASNAVPVSISITDSTEQILTEVRGAKGTSTNTESLGFGIDAIKSLTSGESNIAYGTATLPVLTTGHNNTALGSIALFNLISGSNNIAIGKNALFSNVSVDELIGIGRDALYSNVGGIGNVGIGHRVLRENVSGNNSTAVGSYALEDNTASGISAFGNSALRNNTTGTQNSAFGFSSLITATTSSNNSAFGSRSLRATTGGNNSAFGAQAGDSLSSASGTVLVGYRAGFNLKTGSNNIIIGQQAGLGIESGGDNIIIGRWFNGTAAQANTIILSPGANDPRFYSLADGKTGLGIATPTERLHVGGKLRIDTINDAGTIDSFLVVNGGTVEKTGTSDLLTALGIASSLYTPTTYNTLNVTSSSILSASYTKIGSIVTGTIWCEIEITGSGLTQLDFDLPVASTFSDVYDVRGTAVTVNVLNGNSGAVVADTVNNRMRLTFNGNAVTRQYSLQYQYNITPP